MSTDEYVPSECEVRADFVQTHTRNFDSYLTGRSLTSEQEHYGAQFDAMIARVRRDAVQQFIEACKAKRDEPGFLLPPNHWQDIEAAIRVAESYVKNHPEVTP